MRDYGCRGALASGGCRSAHYEPPTDPAVAPTIAMPEMADERWALRELAHHLDDSGGAAHGPGFAATLIDLVGDVIRPERGWICRVLFLQSAVPTSGQL